ncbi:MAG: TetR/AcrR family transcriptional regulator [Alphaproteobacteria bacterium]|nr:TetR/AcrR family transcriptional regulator [Alphaproteobacteria bacterium]
MPRLTREESRERTRSLLLAAGRSVFARAGYGGASIDTIAETAGFSKGAFYSNFESKEAIFLELLSETMAAELAASRDLAAGGLDVADAIDQIAERYAVEQADQEWCLLSVEFALHVARHPALTEQFADLFERQYKGAATIIAQLAKKAGAKVEDPIKAAALFIAFRQGLALDRASKGAALSEADAKQALRRFMWGLLGRQAP